MSNILTPKKLNSGVKLLTKRSFPFSFPPTKFIDKLDTIFSFRFYKDVFGYNTNNEIIVILDELLKIDNVNDWFKYLFKLRVNEYTNNLITDSISKLSEKIFKGERTSKFYENIFSLFPIFSIQSTKKFNLDNDIIINYLNNCCKMIENIINEYDLDILFTYGCSIRMCYDSSIISDILIYENGKQITKSIKNI